MQFCKDCGTVLNLFGTNEREFCSSCIQAKKQSLQTTAQMETTKPAASDGEDFTLLADAVLFFENDKIILRSKEGWELWSGTPGTQSALKTILARAQRIYEIRLRRQKN